MPKIDSVSWGRVDVDGREYRQVLIIGERIIERDGGKLHQLFGTTHQIGDWEQKLLFSGKPEVILVAAGFNGVLKPSPKLKVQSKKLGVELKIDLTPKAVAEYNRQVGEGKRVNALIHTTC